MKNLGNKTIETNRLILNAQTINKEKYIEYAKNTFKGKALELVLNNIKLFYDDTVIEKNNKYNIGDDVYLKKGTFMHGIREGLGEFE